MACLLCTTAFLNVGGSAHGDDEKNTAMRMIGHRLLSQAGDNISTVPPVEKVDANTFKIRFNKPLSFIPDSLVNTTKAVFSMAAITIPHLVKVVNAATGQITYSYKISNQYRDDVVPCLGRSQPSANYYVTVQFKPHGILAGIQQAGWLPVAGFLLSLASAGVLLFYRKKRVAGNVNITAQNTIGVAGYSLHPGSDTLWYGSNATKLTAREVKAVTLFMQQPNTIIMREAFVKALWSDEGIIVGSRSLDVFISKLRKKIHANPHVSIVNVHGAGYKLQVNDHVQPHS